MENKTSMARKSTEIWLTSVWYESTSQALVLIHSKLELVLQVGCQPCLTNKDWINYRWSVEYVRWSHLYLVICRQYKPTWNHLWLYRPKEVTEQVLKDKFLQESQLWQWSYCVRNLTNETTTNQDSANIKKKGSFTHLCQVMLWLQNRTSYKFVSFFKFPIDPGRGPVSSRL